MFCTVYDFKGDTKMRIEIYNELPEQAKIIREEVFIKEQGFQSEYDEMDEISAHIVLYDNKKAVGVCRIFESDIKDTYIMGRLAVKKEERGKGFGSEIIRGAEKYVLDAGGKLLMLHAQLQAKDFYLKTGFVEYGEVDYEENCPHIWMKKEI